jgi:hypothetical protein
MSDARWYREQVPSRSFGEGEKVSVLGDHREIIIEKRRSNEVKENISLAEHLFNRTILKNQLEKALIDCLTCFKPV